MQTIVITGGAGFIGSNIAASLCAKGSYKIVVCDTLGNSDKWRNLSKHNIAEIIPPQNLFYWLEMFGDTVDAIIHMGGISSTTETDADLLMEHNHTFPLLLWRWCTENNKRLIYASTGETYGDGAQGFDDAADFTYMAKLRPLNAHGWSKHLFDRHIVEAVARGESTPPQWVGLKLFNVYGPNEYHKDMQRSVLCKIFPDAHHGHAVKLYKSYRADIAHGAQKRDFVSVRDVVSVVSWLIDNPKVSGLFNLGSGKARSFEDLAKALFAALGKPPQVKYVDMPETLVDRYQYFTEARMDKLRAAGYSAPFLTLEDGVKDYVQNFLIKTDPYL